MTDQQLLPATLVPGDHLWQITMGTGETPYPVLLLCFERPGPRRRVAVRVYDATTALYARRGYWGYTPTEILAHLAPWGPAFTAPVRARLVELGWPVPTE